MDGLDGLAGKPAVALGGCASAVEAEYVAGVLDIRGRYEHVVQSGGLTVVVIESLFDVKRRV